MLSFFFPPKSFLRRSQLQKGPGLQPSEHSKPPRVRAMEREDKERGEKLSAHLVPQDLGKNKPSNETLGSTILGLIATKVGKISR